MEKTYKSNVITCLGCMNLLMCGRDIRGSVQVRCYSKLLEHGRKILLVDVLDRCFDDQHGCGLLESMRGPGREPWAQYVAELRRNFCEVAE